MNNQFFERPILNSPYGYPSRHWELDSHGQPTQEIIEKRRRAEFITPIPKPKKRKGSAEQTSLLTRQWLDGFLICKGATYPALLMYQELADIACNRITAGNHPRVRR